MGWGKKTTTKKSIHSYPKELIEIVVKLDIWLVFLLKKKNSASGNYPYRHISKDDLSKMQINSVHHGGFSFYSFIFSPIEYSSIYFRKLKLKNGCTPRAWAQGPGTD